MADEPDGAATESAATPEQEAAFDRLFGVSEAELRSRGVDTDQYAVAHISEAMERRGPPSYRFRNKYYDWRFRTLAAFIVLGLIAGLVGGATGPLRTHTSARIALLVVCTAIMGFLIAADLRARGRYRRAMRAEAAAEASGTGPALSRGEFSSTSATLARGRFAIGVPVSPLAEVTIHEGVLVLRQSPGGTELARVDVRSVRIQQPRMFLGTGLKLDLGSAGQWIVGFSQRYGLLDDARADMRHFIKALREAQGPGA